MFTKLVNHLFTMKVDLNAIIVDIFVIIIIIVWILKRQHLRGHT